MLHSCIHAELKRRLGSDGDTLSFVNRVLAIAARIVCVCRAGGRDASQSVRDTLARLLLTSTLISLTSFEVNHIGLQLYMGL